MSEPKEYQLTISAKEVSSTDPLFDREGFTEKPNFYYRTKDVYYTGVKGEENDQGDLKRILPRLALKVFESDIDRLSKEQRHSFPIMKNGSQPGIYLVSEKSTLTTYDLKYNEKYVIHARGLFSTIPFVQECLKRFNDVNGRFVFTYLRKRKE